MPTRPGRTLPGTAPSTRPETPFAPGRAPERVPGRAPETPRVPGRAPERPFAPDQAPGPVRTTAPLEVPTPARIEAPAPGKAPGIRTETPTAPGPKTTPVTGTGTGTEPGTGTGTTPGTGTITDTDIVTVPETATETATAIETKITTETPTRVSVGIGKRPPRRPREEETTRRLRRPGQTIEKAYKSPKDKPWPAKGAWQMGISQREKNLNTEQVAFGRGFLSTFNPKRDPVESFKITQFGKSRPKSLVIDNIGAFVGRIVPERNVIEFRRKVRLD